MAYKVIRSRGSVQGIPKRVFICDALSDIASLPTNKKPGLKQDNDTVSDEPCAIGSIASVTETGNVYELSASGEWKYRPTSGNPEDPGETPEDPTSSIELDTTLTVSGKAADAKAVGDALKDYVKTFDAISTYVNKTEAKNYVTKDFMSSYLSVQSAETNYAKKTDLDNYVTTEDAHDTYAEKGDLDKYALSSTLSDYVTKDDAESTYASKTDLDPYLTTETATSTFAKKTDLDSYALTEDLSGYLTSENAGLLYAKKADLDNYVTSEDAAAFATQNDLDDYVTESDASSIYASKEELGNVVGNPGEGYNSLESIGEIIDQLNAKVEAIRNSISSSTAVLADGDSVQDAIADSGIITVAMVPGTFTGELTLNRTVNLVGYNSSIPANSGNRCSDVIDDSETVIDGTINIAGENDVVLTGLTFTDNALINISNKGTLTLKNCKILSMEADAAKSYLLKSMQSNPLKLIVENCYFGTNTANSVGNIYNGLELNCTLKDGSSISNNYFAAAACTHNAINIYAVEDNATIHIDNNHFEYSGNAIRIGIKGEPTCTIVCDGNSYDATDSTDEYAGLLLVQPYGKQTTSFANCTIKIDNTVHSDNKQLYYLYAGAGDMQFTDSNKPTVIVGGITEIEPIV